LAISGKTTFKDRTWNVSPNRFAMQTGRAEILGYYLLHGQDFLTKKTINAIKPFM